jgi:hypothetical protein
MIFPRKGRKGWVIVEWWGDHRAAKGVLVSSYKGIWEVRIKSGSEEFAVVADKCDIYTSERRAKREASRRRTAARA